MKAGSFRFGIVAVLMLATAIGLQAHSRNENFPPRDPLSSLPSQIDGWTGTDDPIDQETLNILGHGEYLLRDYANASQAATMDQSLHRVLSVAKGGRYHPFAEPLPAGRRMGSDFAGDGSAHASGRLFIPRQPLRGYKIGRAATGAVLVSGAWPRGGQRVAGQVLSDRRFDSHESQRRRDGALDDPNARRRVSRCRPGAHDEARVAVPCRCSTTTFRARL